MSQLARHDATPQRGGALRRATAAIATGGLVLGMMTLGAVPAVHAAGTTDGTVSGTVFQDFGSTGYFTSGDAGAGVPRNRPIAGITATAYDVDGDIVGTATSAADGTYTVDVQDAYSNDIRIEFSGWNEEYQPGFAAQAATPPALSEGENDTSVQFVTMGTPDADAADFSLIIPDQVIQANAPISTAIQYAGDPLNPNNDLGVGDAIVAQPWSDFGSSDDPAWPFDRVTLADFTEVGSVWGTSYIRNANMMLATPTLKRMAGFGPGGPGGIYRIDDVLNPDGSLNASAPDPFVWFDVEDLTVLNGGSIDLGTIPSNTDRGLATFTDPAEDAFAFQNAARVGIGGLATSLDGRAMFFANLNDKSVYAARVEDPDSPPTVALRIPTPVGDDQQLWAVTAYGSRLWVGYVDTGTRPGIAAADAGMRAYVVSTSMADLVRATWEEAPVPVSSSIWRTELTIDLGYAKGSNMQDWPNRPPGNTTCVPQENGTGSMDETWPQLTRWNSWSDVWAWDSAGSAVDSDDPYTPAVVNGGGSVGLPGGCFYGTGWEQVYAQPVLSGIAFDIDGYMILGFTDRTAIQSGNRNHAAVSNPTGDRFWESISNGDTLIAAPASLAGTSECGDNGENFVLECNGVVGERGPRTETHQNPYDPVSNPNNDKFQQPTYNDNEGPLTGEFLNDRRDQGAGANHNENTLGSVVTYPGVDEIASSAMDPYVGINRNGLMWFDQNTGLATRGFDQVIGDQENTSQTFQKGGGLGSVALLGIASPVEIGNRVWLDADLNGRQDPDEPAIDGAPVELWTANALGEPVCLLGTTVTATLDGQPGTYYFRSDDTALHDVACDAGGFASFTTNGEYVVAFPSGTGAVNLAGPNAGHPGFAGLDWSQLVRTTQEVVIAPTDTNGGTTSVNDSNPDVESGEAPVRVGGPGENDHTIDAGWYGVAPYELLKDVTGPAPPDTVYTVEMTAATNFRGQDRLTAAGADPGARDPQVTTTSFELTPGTPVAAGQDLPYGYTLAFEETDPVLPSGAVTYDPADPADPSRGLLVISPQSGEDVATLTVTNAYGSFQVVKTNVGDEAAVAAASDLEFTVNWTSDQPETSTGETSGSFTVTGDGTPAPDPALGFPVGTQVTLDEVEPTVLPPGVAWTGGEWTAAPPDVVVNEDGTATVTIADNDGASVAVALTNTFADAFGSFSVTKQIAQGSDFPDLSDPVYDTVQIPFTYSYTVPGEEPVTDQSFILSRANDFTFSSEGFPAGTVVTVTEGTPAGLPVDMSMTVDGWTGEGVTSEGASATFTVGDGTTVAAVITNETTQRVGTFEVTKWFEGIEPDDPRLADVVVTIAWTAPDGATGTIELTQDTGWTAGPVDDAGDPVVFPLGTVVSLEETSVTGLPPSLEWTDVTWAPADPEDPALGQVTVSSDTTPAAVAATNGTIEFFGQFSVTKQVTGPVELTDDIEFRVTYTYDGLEEPGMLIVHDGETAISPYIPVGTVVTISELTPTGGLPAGAGWGTPVFVLPDGTTTSGPVSITIDTADEVVAVQLENPTLPPLPPTGAALPWLAAVIAVLLTGGGLALYLIGRRRRRNGQPA